jgi:hypothetical protein
LALAAVIALMTFGLSIVPAGPVFDPVIYNALWAVREQSFFLANAWKSEGRQRWFSGWRA